MSIQLIRELKQVPRVGCSPIKELRELGLERRETVWSLSTVNVED